MEALKWLAIITMTVDHIGAVLLPEHEAPFRTVGRLAFPSFAFLIAHNYTFVTRNAKRYMLRLGVFALLSQPVYVITRETHQLNILFTFLLGLAFVYLWESVDREHAAHALVARAFYALLLLIVSPAVEYWTPGVFLVSVFCIWLRRGGLAWVGCAMALLALAHLTSWLGVVAASAVLLPAVIAQWPATLPRTNRWFFYIYYPAHLAALALLGWLSF